MNSHSRNRMLSEASMAPSDQADFDEEVKRFYRVQIDQVRVQMVRLERRNVGRSMNAKSLWRKK